MITVRFDICSCTVTGHAGSGAYGQDLVCAAVSALTLSLAAGVTALPRQRLREVILEPGDARIRALPRWGGKRRAEAVFDAAYQGFSRLAKEYPEYVRVRGIEREGTGTV